MRSIIQPPTTYAIKCDWCKDKIEAGESFLTLNMFKTDRAEDDLHFCCQDCLDEFIADHTKQFKGQASEDYINANGEETTERNSAWGMYNDTF